MSAILRFPDFKYKAFSMSYDDGAETDKRLIDIMLKNGIVGTFNLPTDRMKKGIYPTRDDIREVYINQGMEVAVHGERHCSLAAIDTAVALSDVLICRRDLEEVTGKIVKGMAYANGSINDDVIEMLRLSGIEWSRNSGSSESLDIPRNLINFSATAHHKNKRLFELADKLIDEPISGYYWSRTPRLMIVWGHSFEFDKNDNWDLIERLCERVGGKDDIWYATLGDIFSYVLDFKKLRFSADGTLIHNPTARPLFLYDFGKNIKIEPGETVDTKTL